MTDKTTRRPPDRTKKKNYPILMLLLFILLTVYPARSSEQRDYSEGFGKLYKMGLPDVSNAEYVKLSLDISDFLSFPYNDIFSKFKLSGNAWVIEENKDGASRIVFKNQMIEVMNMEHYMKTLKEAENADGKGRLAEESGCRRQPAR
ncbi:hypothetical protein QUF72_16775 [Desulfobacterales bacterium HSG2]|nr:hypothetical protein [Desulfobacterales bacterium HSG2]